MHSLQTWEVFFLSCYLSLLRPFRLESLMGWDNSDKECCLFQLWLSFTLFRSKWAPCSVCQTCSRGKKNTKTLSRDCIRPVQNGSKTCVVSQMINTIRMPISGEGNVLPGSRWSGFLTSALSSFRLPRDHFLQRLNLGELYPYLHKLRINLAIVCELCLSPEKTHNFNVKCTHNPGSLLWRMDSKYLL